MNYTEGYGYCPACGTTRGLTRERRIDGYTTCACGAKTPSRDWKRLDEKTDDQH